MKSADAPDVRGELLGCGTLASSLSIPKQIVFRLSSCRLMGKYTLLLTLAAVLGFTYFAQQSQQRARSANEDQVERQKTVIARQIARSAFDKGLSKVKRNFGSISEHSTSKSYEGGNYVVTYDDAMDGGDKVVQIEAQGTYQDATYRIAGTARKQVVMPGLFSGITADGDIDFIGSSGKGCSGLACVSGTTGNGDDRPGMNLPGSMELGNDDCPNNWDSGDIKGGPEEVLNECSVYSRNESESEWMGNKMEDMKEKIVDQENKNYDKKCDGGCTIRGNSGGKENGKRKGKGGEDEAEEGGIMYVPPGESLRINGTATWDGLVYVAEGGDVTIKGGGGKGSGKNGNNNRNINGALLMEGHKKNDEGEIENRSEFDMSGGNRVQYNPDKIRDYIDVSKYNKEITEVTTTDRKSCVLPDGSEQCPTAED